MAVRLNPVPDHPTPAVVADRRQRLNRALEAVEGVARALRVYFERFVRTRAAVIATAASAATAPSWALVCTRALLDTCAATCNAASAIASSTWVRDKSDARLRGLRQRLRASDPFRRSTPAAPPPRPPREQDVPPRTRPVPRSGRCRCVAKRARARPKPTSYAPTRSPAPRSGRAHPSRTRPEPPTQHQVVGIGEELLRKRGHAATPRSVHALVHCPRRTVSLHLRSHGAIPSARAER